MKHTNKLLKVFWIVGIGFVLQLALQSNATAQFFDDFGSGGRAVAESFGPDSPFIFGNECWWKATRIGRQGTIDHNPGNFPMSDDGIFAGRLFSHFTVTALRR